MFHSDEQRKERGDYMRDRAKDERAELMTTEFQKLQARWLRKKGTAMPEDIARLPLETIRKAVILVEAGHEVGVPRQAVDVEDYGSSMSDWDGHNNHT